jgi:hypothetical protein
MHSEFILQAVPLTLQRPDLGFVRHASPAGHCAAMLHVVVVVTLHRPM